MKCKIGKIVLNKVGESEFWGRIVTGETTITSNSFRPASEGEVAAKFQTIALHYGIKITAVETLEDSDSSGCSISAPEGTEAEQSDDPQADGPELFNNAVKLVLSEQRASPSLLQRKFNIGYTKASDLCEEMERQGIVGPVGSDNFKRECLMSLEEWQNKNAEPSSDPAEEKAPEDNQPQTPSTQQSDDASQIDTPQQSPS